MRGEGELKTDYPVMLRLEGRSCLVVGGGQVARRKVKGLLECGAKVTVIAPELVPGLAQLAQKGKIRHISRSYRRGEVKGAFLVIGATDDQKVNRRLAKEAMAQGILVNIVDQPELCNFTLPARFTRGPVTIAIATGGASPALARQLRLLLEEIIEPEYGRLAELMGKLRKEVMLTFPTEAKRRQAWEKLLHSKVLVLLCQGKNKEAEAEAKACLSSRSV